MSSVELDVDDVPARTRAPAATVRFAIAVSVVLTVFVQHSLWVADGGVVQVWALTDAIEAQRESNAALQARNARLTAEVDSLRAGLEVIEERARRDLGLIGPNETFYLFVDE